jgi:hypothetical protein
MINLKTSRRNPYFMSDHWNSVGAKGEVWSEKGKQPPLVSQRNPRIRCTKKNEKSRPKVMLIFSACILHMGRLWLIALTSLRWRIVQGQSAKHHLFHHHLRYRELIFFKCYRGIRTVIQLLEIRLNISILACKDTEIYGICVRNDKPGSSESDKIFWHCTMKVTLWAYEGKYKLPDDVPICEFCSPSKSWTFVNKYTEEQCEGLV